MKLTGHTRGFARLREQLLGVNTTPSAPDHPVIQGARPLWRVGLAGRAQC